MQNLGLFKITPDQKKSTIEMLIASSSPTQSFFLVLIISAIIACFGLLLDNVAIVIGGMLVSPLLSSILAISMGIVMADGKLIFRSFKVLVMAMFFVIIISLIISVFYVDKEINNEILSRVTVSFSYFLIALASGVAAAFAFAKAEFSERMVGVAVAIALLPPLSVIGIGIAFWDWSILAGSLGLFFVNLFGILLGSLVVFSLFRFYPAKIVVDRELEQEERELEKEKNNN